MFSEKQHKIARPGPLPCRMAAEFGIHGPRDVYYHAPARARAPRRFETQRLGPVEAGIRRKRRAARTARGASPRALLTTVSALLGRTTRASRCVPAPRDVVDSGQMVRMPTILPARASWHARCEAPRPERCDEAARVSENIAHGTQGARNGRGGHTGYDAGALSHPPGAHVLPRS